MNPQRLPAILVTLPKIDVLLSYVLVSQTNQRCLAGVTLNRNVVVHTVIPNLLYRPLRDSSFRQCEAVSFCCAAALSHQYRACAYDCATPLPSK